MSGIERPPSSGATQAPSLSPSAPSRTSGEASGTPLAGREPRGLAPAAPRRFPAAAPSLSLGQRILRSLFGRRISAPPGATPQQQRRADLLNALASSYFPSAKRETFYRALSEGALASGRLGTPPLAEDKEETRALKAELGSLSVPELNRMAARLVSPGLTRATSALLARARSGNEEAAALHPGLQDQAAGRIASNLRSVYRAVASELEARGQPFHAPPRPSLEASGPRERAQAEGLADRLVSLGSRASFSAGRVEVTREGLAGAPSLISDKGHLLADLESAVPDEGFLKKADGAESPVAKVFLADLTRARMSFLDDAGHPVQLLSAEEEAVVQGNDRSAAAEVLEKALLRYTGGRAEDVRRITSLMNQSSSAPLAVTLAFMDKGLSPPAEEIDRALGFPPGRGPGGDEPAQIVQGRKDSTPGSIHERGSLWGSGPSYAVQSRPDGSYRMTATFSSPAQMITRGGRRLELDEARSATFYRLEMNLPAGGTGAEVSGGELSWRFTPASEQGEGSEG